ncbi:hypothetical protein MWH06_06315 [Wolbachia pipientis]|nr:hypothetical protein MWH06_06315 [Wolbachia pipientis]
MILVTLLSFFYRLIRSRSKEIGTGMTKKGGYLDDKGIGTGMTKKGLLG